VNKLNSLIFPLRQILCLNHLHHFH